MEISIIPRWLISRFSKDYWRQNDINLLISNFCIVLFFLLFRNSILEILNLLPHFCLFDKLIGVECPVCGTTRAFCAMANGNLRNAIVLNISSFFVASFFIFQIPLRLFSLCKTNSNEKINLISKYFSHSVIVVILVNWLIKISMQ
jgi:hypothetical protein